MAIILLILKPLMVFFHIQVGKIKDSGETGSFLPTFGNWRIGGNKQTAQPYYEDQPTGYQQ